MSLIVMGKHARGRGTWPLWVQVLLVWVGLGHGRFGSRSSLPYKSPYTVKDWGPADSEPSRAESGCESNNQNHLHYYAERGKRYVDLIPPSTPDALATTIPGDRHPLLRSAVEYCLESESQMTALH